MKTIWLALLFTACAASKNDARYPQPGEENQTAEQKDDENPTECHEERVTGSNLPRTVCRPKEKAKEEDNMIKNNWGAPVAHPTSH